MNKNKPTMEEVLRELIQIKGLDFLRTGKNFVNAFYDLGGSIDDRNLLQHFIDVEGHIALLDVKDITLEMKKARYVQIVEELQNKKFIALEHAHRVCKAFWQAVYNTEPPVAAPQIQKELPKPVPQQPKLEPSKAVPPSPKPTPNPVPPLPKPPIYTKNELYITAEEARTGGKIDIYRENYSKIDVVNIPPNTKDGAQIAPVYKIRVYKPSDNYPIWSNKEDWSDSLLEDFIKRKSILGITRELLRQSFKLIGFTLLGLVFLLFSIVLVLDTWFLIVDSSKNAFGLWSFPLLVFSCFLSYFFFSGVYHYLADEILDIVRSRKEAKTELRQRNKPIPKSFGLFIPIVILVAIIFFGILLFRDNAKTPDLSAFPLDTAVLEIVENGDTDYYEYMDGSYIKMFFDDVDNERCRIYVNKDGVTEYVFTAEYNEEGNILSQLTYDSTGALYREDQYTRNEDGHWTEIKILNGEGKTLQTTTRTFDKQGREKTITIASGNKTLSKQTFKYDSDSSDYTITENDGSYAKYEHDEDGNLVLLMLYNKKGKLYYSEEYLLNSDGSVTGGIISDGDGNVTSSYTQDNNRVKTTNYYDDGTSNSYSSTFLMSSDGEYIGSIEEYDNCEITYEYIDSILGTMVKALHKYDYDGTDYDSYGFSTYDVLENITESIDYDYDKNLSSHTVYTYNKYGVETGHISTIYYDNGTYSVTEYDADWNEISSKEYDADGNGLE